MGHKLLTEKCWKFVISIYNMFSTTSRYTTFHIASRWEIQNYKKWAQWCSKDWKMDYFSKSKPWGGKRWPWGDTWRKGGNADAKCDLSRISNAGCTWIGRATKVSNALRREGRDERASTQARTSSQSAVDSEKKTENQGIQTRSRTKRMKNK